ncbi:GNAT family N-acetyltransferase [Oceanobacillus kimchii]|uniref:GNAT family N-acetyltransferase n=1 Tax=Oceanobacillus kimchii TaxID=746691 RepID=UPI00034806D1|nr:GNAT family N-acetyltransferase [Oceanobacillus kimchii]MCT1577633.1 GNAT family N-acetyltransferase [Oceanobacillus kimchii]MCT2136621.1 GNAT family N-acetyltransferase [Oceanobacillus kimchii]
MIQRLKEIENAPMKLLLLADPSESIVIEYLQRGSCYVLEKNNQVIGEYVLIPTRPETIEIVNVAVDESFHGQGFGKKLILHAIEESKKLGYKTIEIGTGNSGVNQLALYQKCGFRMIGIDRDFFVRHYDEPIFENGIQVIDMVRLSMDI